MFSKLENSIKSEIANVIGDMGHLMKRVEEAEEKTGQQAQEIGELKAQVSKLQLAHREHLYKLEDQHNHNRHQNLRIRALPEQQGGIFTPLLGRSEEYELKID